MRPLLIDKGLYRVIGTLVGASVMVTLFSIFENPAWFMRHIRIW